MARVRQPIGAPSRKAIANLPPALRKTLYKHATWFGRNTTDGIKIRKIPGMSRSQLRDMVRSGITENDGETLTVHGARVLRSIFHDANFRAAGFYAPLQGDEIVNRLTPKRMADSAAQRNRSVWSLIKYGWWCNGSTLLKLPKDDAGQVKAQLLKHDIIDSAFDKATADRMIGHIDTRDPTGTNVFPVDPALQPDGIVLSKLWDFTSWHSVYLFRKGDRTIPFVAPWEPVLWIMQTHTDARPYHDPVKRSLIFYDAKDRFVGATSVSGPAITERLGPDPAQNPRIRYRVPY